MFFLKPKTKLLLALNINVSNVQAVVFRAHKNGKPEIIRTFQKAAAFSPEADFSVLLQGIKRVLAEIFKEIGERAFKIDGVFVSLSSSWYFAQPKIIKLKEQENFELTEEILDQQLEKIISGVKEEFEKKFSVSREELAVLESRLFKILLNGYQVFDFRNKKIKTAELYAYLSVAPRNLMEEIKKIAKENLGADNVHFHTSSLILFEKMRETFGWDENFLIADVGEEITEVIIVKSGLIKEISSFSKGGNFIVRRIISSLKISPEEAFSHLKMNARNELIEGLKSKIENILKEAFEEWEKTFKEILNDFYRFEGPLPERIFMFNSAPFPERFAAAASFPGLSDIFARGKPPIVSAFTPAAFRNEFLKEPAFKYYNETAISFLTLFLNRHVWQKS